MNAWLQHWTGLSLLQPQWLWLLAVLAVLPWLPWWQGWRRGRRPALAFAPAVLLAGAPLPATWRTRVRHLPAVAAIAAVLLLTVALARPARRVELPAVRAGIDIALCVDVSSSMAARDLDPRRDRLAVARAAATAFVAGRRDDRVALLRFARFPDVMCPPTLDHAALQQILAELQFVARDGPEDATGIGTAVAGAVDLLRRAPSRSRVVVLVTDGEENVAVAGSPGEIGPLQAAQLAALHGVRVYALAVGATGRAADGSATAIDTQQIEALAQRTGGRFFAAADAQSLTAVFAAIDALEAAPWPQPRYRFDERYAPFALAALLAMVLAVVLRRTVGEVLP